MLRIADAQRERADAAEIATGLIETVALARVRGEVVECGEGVLRISSRDGLRSLRRAGHISDDHYEVGLRYRAGFETRGRDLRVAGLEPGRGGGHDNDRFVAARLRRAHLLDFVVRADRAVALGLTDSPIALRLLRSVAGEGSSLSMYGAGRALSSHRMIFIKVLDLLVKLSRGSDPDNRP